MTHPGHGSNDINLATMWIPLLPETSRMGEEMEKSGKESKRRWEQGFNSGSSPESLGQSYGSKITASIGKEFKNFELPFGMSGFLDKFSNDIDQKLVGKLRGEATSALQSYRSEYDNLTAAQGRASEAESKLATAREGGFNKASIMLPLIQENTRAQTELTTAHTNATNALNSYNEKSSLLNEELGKTAKGGEILAGVMGGALVLGAGLAVSAVEHLVEGIAEGFKKSIELGVELAKTAVELGETYEHVGIQIHEFSTASGEDFTRMEEAAQHVFSTLDVAGNDTGKTMAQLSSMLKVPGENIQGLVRDVTELQGRFTNLRATDLGSIFTAFKVPADQFDSSLASMLQSSRGAGQGLGDLANTLSGNVAVTLAEANLNLEQAGKFTADLMVMGTPGRQVMTGMATAMKDFASVGLTFADGMKMAGEKLKELGDTAEGQQLAEKLFGTRNWVVAGQAVQNYIDIVNAGPDAFHASESSVHEFLDATANLGNEIELFKHKAEDAFKPFGDAAKNAAASGLNSISIWFDTHREQIIGDIKNWGLEFINMLPTIQSFAVDGLRMFGDFASGVMFVLAPIAQTAAAAGAGMLALSGHFGEAKDLLTSVNKIDPMKIQEMANNLADKIAGINIDTAAISQNFSDAADAALRIPPSIGAGVGGPNPFGTGGSGGGGHGSPGGLNLPGITAPGGANASAANPFGIPSPGSGGGPIDPGSVKSLARQLFPWDESQWAAFVTLEEHEAGFDPTAKNPSSGAFGVGQFLGHEHDAYASGYSTDPATQLQTMFQYIKDRYGTPGAAWAQYYQHPGGQGYYQHGGPIPLDPNWASPTDPGYIDPSTVQQSPNVTGGTPHGWYDKYPQAAEGFAPGRLQESGKQHGSFAPWMTWGLHPLFAKGGPSGTDTVPAWLTPGEYVWDTPTVDKFGWLIELLHGAKGFQGGGAVDDVVGVDPQIGFVDEIAKGFQLQLTAGKSGHGTHTIDGGYHDSGEAGDFANGVQTDQELAFAMYMFEHFGSQLAELIYDDPRMTKLIKDGSPVEPGFYGKDLPDHKNHVHIAVKATTTMSDLSPGNEALSAGLGQMPSFGGPGATPGGRTGSSFPGMAGQYGGLGAYGGQTADQAASTAKAVQEAKDRADALDHQVSQNEKRIRDLQDQLGKVGQATKHDALGLPVKLTPDELAAADDKRKQLNDQLDEATYQLGVSQRDRAQQNTNISDAERKQQESYLKRPTGAGQTTQKPVGAAAFAALGSSFLSGVGQELGFGDLFSKPPWEWGAVKLLTGAASWAMGTANAWAEQIGQGKTGIGGPGWGANSGIAAPGWDQAGGVGTSMFSGLAGSVGLNLPTPKTGVSAGPNVVATQPPGPFGPPTGPAPGPVIQGDYMPINVSSDVSKDAVLGPVQEQRNAQNSNTYTYSGGFPAP